jgi:CheY-like chemotaxis protein
MPRLGGGEFRRAQLGDPTVAGVPVAVMSGAVDLDERAQALGAVASVAKPIDVDVLMDVVRRYCVSAADRPARSPADPYNRPPTA